MRFIIYAFISFCGFFSAVTGFCFGISADNGSNDSEERQRLVPYINQIFGTLDHVTEKDFGSQKVICRETVVSVLQAIRENKLGISIDRELPNSFITGIGFRYSEDKKSVSLAINPKVLENFRENRSIVFSTLVHEMRHAADYLKDPDYYYRLKDNIFERYLFELDAYYTQAQFIKVYLHGQKEIKLTKFEKFLLDSWEKNGLDEFSITMQAFDRLTTKSLLKIQRSQESTVLKQKNILDLMNKFATNSKPLNGNDQEKYEYLVKIRTLTTFIPQIIYDIKVIGSKAEFPREKYLEGLPDHEKTLMSLSAILANNREFFNAYGEKKRAAFEIAIR